VRIAWRSIASDDPPTSPSVGARACRHCGAQRSGTRDAHPSQVRAHRCRIHIPLPAHHHSDEEIALAVEVCEQAGRARGCGAPAAPSALTTDADSGALDNE
jgi:hypothetical protein